MIPQNGGVIKFERVIKNEQLNLREIKNNIKQEDKKYMPRKMEVPRINTATIVYNGNIKLFNTFMESMIAEYLNSDSVPKNSDGKSGDKVENSENTE